MPDLMPMQPKLRHWQEEALRAYRRHSETDFLTVATPGAGKTTFALAVARRLIESSEVSHVIVICPTDHLKTQWANAAHRMGIHLSPHWENRDCVLPLDFHGMAVTYQQVASNPAIFRNFVQKHRVFAVFDEIHHAGDMKSWGGSIRHSFESAVKRLALSGTPFRTDRTPIPFVKYAEEGDIKRCKPDYTYTYGYALADNVCRPVMFPSYDGEMEWLSRTGVITATFKDEIPEDEASRRLKTALSLSGNWLPSVLEEADRKLTECRCSGHEDAAGLVIAIDQNHAKGIAPILRRIAGESPIIAISEDPDASLKIESFRKSAARWIIAVRMISEGVDIPRLRVGVYATNVISTLFFRQAVGRFVRIIDGIEEQNAYLFIPREETLSQYAQQITEEIEAELRDTSKRLDEELERMEREEASRQLGLFQPYSSEARPDDVYWDGNSFPQEELARAKDVKTQAGLHRLNDVEVAKILRAAGLSSAPVVAPAHRAEESDPVFRTIKQLKDLIHRLVSQLAFNLKARGEYPDIKDACRDLNKWLADMTGAYRKEASIEQLREQKNMLEKKLTEITNGQPFTYFK